eukprot:GDKI01040486.1.p3 GENE.GDKI01040486.1~~GDKI01040486.1.p3  ORF type:complete len:108 (-),score=7.66 GDKI01040486.1:429-752(-)
MPAGVEFFVDVDQSNNELWFFQMSYTMRRVRVNRLLCFICDIECTGLSRSRHDCESISTVVRAVYVFLNTSYCMGVSMCVCECACECVFGCLFFVFFVCLCGSCAGS